MTRHEETQNHYWLDLSHCVAESSYAVVYHRVYRRNTRNTAHYDHRKSADLIQCQQGDTQHGVNRHQNCVLRTDEVVYVRGRWSGVCISECEKGE